MKWHLNRSLMDQEAETVARAFSGNSVDKVKSVIVYAAHWELTFDRLRELGPREGR